MPRFRAITTIVHKAILDVPADSYMRDAEQTAIEQAVEAIERDELGSLIYAVELEPLTEEGEG